MGSTALNVQLVPRPLLVHKVWNLWLIQYDLLGEHLLLPDSFLSHGNRLLQLHSAPRLLFELDRWPAGRATSDDILHSLMHMRRLLLSLPEAC